MITFTVSRNGNKAKFRVPCKEDDIRDVQSQLEIPYDTDTRVYIDGVDSNAPELCILEGQNGNLDFMNLLGRVMYGMDCGEFEQFRAGLFVEEPGDITEIINLAQSVDRYSLIKEDDLRESGLNHEMNLRGAIPKAEIEKTDYVAIAQKLIDSGECEDTPYGKVYVNKDHPISEFFDGKHMPAYYDRHCQYAVTLRNENGDEDCMFLPCTRAELMRAAARLHTAFPNDLTYEIDDTELEDERLGQYMEGADIQTLNEYAGLIDNMDSEETEKFIAVVDYCQQYFKGADNPRNILKICKNLDSFSYVSGIDNCRDLGDYLIAESGDYNYDADLDNYYNYEAFGEDYLGEQAGRFTEHGYVGINDWETVQHYLSSDAMEMGGM